MRLSVLFTALWVLTGCAAGDDGTDDDPQSAKRPNVLLITLDTTRADALGTYGQPLPTTPEIDRLAASGAVFEAAYTASPSTLPSHATILTGRLPFAHGVRSNAGYQLDPGNHTLAEVFAEHGYATAAEIAAPVIGGRTGLGQGFETYRDLRSFEIVRKTVRVLPGSAEEGGEARPVELSEREAGDIARAGIEFLRQPRDTPFFLWLHFFDPHSFYLPPSPWNRRFRDSPYHAEVHYTDYHVGRVLHELRQQGISDDTLVVLTADHGEALGEHDEPSHSFFVYDSTMRVPLILSFPGRISGGRRVRTPVRTADIAPTILDLVGLPALSDIQGVSLAAALRGEVEPSPRDVYGESIEAMTMFGSSALRFLRRGRWKYIHKLHPGLYDLEEDPAELVDRSPDQPERVAALSNALREWVLREASPHPGSRLRIDAEMRAELDALGYVATAAPREFEDAGDLGALHGPDPRDKLPDLGLYGMGWAAIKADKFDEALVLFGRAFANNPDSLPILRALVRAQVAVGVPGADRIRLLERGLELDPSMLEFYGHLGEAWAEVEEPAEAERAFRAGLAVDACHAPLRVLLANLLQDAGRHALQIQVLQQGIAGCEATADFRNDYAYLLATSSDPKLRDGRAALSIARAVVEESGRKRPDYIDTLACAYAAVGDFSRALRLADEALGMLARRKMPPEVLALHRAHREQFARGEAVGAGG